MRVRRAAVAVLTGAVLLLACAGIAVVDRTDRASLLTDDLIEHERAHPQQNGAELYGRLPGFVRVGSDGYRATMGVVWVAAIATVLTHALARAIRREPVLGGSTGAMLSFLAFVASLSVVWLAWTVPTHRRSGDTREVALFRRAVALDTAAYVSLAFCGLAVAVGIGWVVEDRLRRRADVTQTVWGGALALAGVLVAWSLLGDFDLLWRCC